VLFVRRGRRGRSARKNNMAKSSTMALVMMMRAGLSPVRYMCHQSVTGRLPARIAYRQVTRIP
jgi:hypothetical protein